jgi:hypothetical protein
LDRCYRRKTSIVPRTVWKMPASTLALALALTELSLAGCRMGEVVGSPGATEGEGDLGLPPGTGGPEVMLGERLVEPGRVVAHRLNRVEYDNTIRDLFFGLDLHPAAAFPLDSFAEGFDNNAQELRMSNLLFEKYVEAAEQIVPAAFADPEVRRQLLVCDPGAEAACAHRVLLAFAERAFRRPVRPTELGPYLSLIDSARQQGDSAEVGLQLAFQAVLLSPSFLYRIEPDPPAGSTRGLDGFELASRLSYFLWSSMPDPELFARAADGSLARPEGLFAQVGRMLDDGKGAALIDNLAGQWLYTRQLAEVTPDADLFPEDQFDSDLRQSMRRETHLFVKEILLGDHSALDLLKADFTFADRRLARHYGLPGADQLGDGFQRVPVEGPRGGLLMQAGWLTLTSHPDVTSPTKRGKWILSELLCQTPPAPPPGADRLPVRSAGTTRREQLAQHASVEPCRSCHRLFDPLGMALENFDPIGRWRDEDEGQPVDAAGVVPGTNLAFEGPEELAQALQGDARFGRCLVRKLLTYALGRGMEATDEPAIDHLASGLARGGHRFRDLVQAIAASPLMGMRGGKSQP